MNKATYTDQLVEFFNTIQPEVESEADIKFDVHPVRIFIKPEYKAGSEAYESAKVNLASMLDAYPNQKELKGGPSYIHAGATLGDQGTAIRFFLLAEYFGLGNIMTGARMTTASNVDSEYSETVKNENSLSFRSGLFYLMSKGD